MAQDLLNGRFRMIRYGVEQRHGGMLLLDKHYNFGAAFNEAFGALRMKIVDNAQE
jgi:hypothetical protein